MQSGTQDKTKYVEEKNEAEVKRQLNNIKYDTELCFRSIKEIINANSSFSVAQIKNRILLNAKFYEKIAHLISNGDGDTPIIQLTLLERIIGGYITNAFVPFVTNINEPEKIYLNLKKAVYTLLDPNKKDDLLKEIRNKLISVNGKTSEPDKKNRSVVPKKRANPKEITDPAQKIAQEYIHELSLDKSQMFDRMLLCCGEPHPMKVRLKYSCKKSF